MTRAALPIRFGPKAVAHDHGLESALALYFGVLKRRGRRLSMWVARIAAGRARRLRDTTVTMSAGLRRHLGGQLGHVLNPLWQVTMRTGRKPEAGRRAARREQLHVPSEVLCEAEADIERRVRMVIADQLGIDDVEVWPEGRLLEDFGADSLDVAELLVALEEEFGTAIDEGEVTEVTTVEEAIMCVVRAFDWIDEGEGLEATLAPDPDIPLDPVELPPAARKKRPVDVA